MNFNGLIIGIAAFVIIGAFHPIVIKSEYYFGKQVWRAFLVMGLVFAAATLFIQKPHPLRHPRYHRFLVFVEHS